MFISLSILFWGLLENIQKHCDRVFLTALSLFLFFLFNCTLILWLLVCWLILHKRHYLVPFSSRFLFLGFYFNISVDNWFIRAPGVEWRAGEGRRNWAIFVPTSKMDANLGFWRWWILFDAHTQFLPFIFRLFLSFSVSLSSVRSSYLSFVCSLALRLGTIASHARCFQGGSLLVFWTAVL